ncbi:MAG: hypothetical protein M5R36_09015 [Deltaproteobacteria bacterium]|nr:hypothetical protein [Deltaproteobacteria bacterium]
MLVAAAALAVFAGTALAEDAALRGRADAYLTALRAAHIPGDGGIVQVVYETPALENVLFYKGQGDSTMWTSTYLAAECFRYAVTGDPDAKANAIEAVHVLENHLRVTQTTGYIGRYVGPIDTPFILDYLTSDELRWGEGEYLGKFWLSNGSSDQYIGWFFGLGVAYDLIDDGPTRDLIRSMVREVIDELRDNFWLIITDTGWPSTAAPNIGGGERMAFLLTAAHVIDEPEYWTLYEQEFEAGKDLFPFQSIAFFNKYTEYFAFNLRHLNYYAIFNYETDPERRAFYLEIYDRMVRSLVRGTHNAWFDFIYLTMTDGAPADDDPQQMIDDALHALSVFPDPPNTDTHRDIPPAADRPVVADLCGHSGVDWDRPGLQAHHEGTARCREPMPRRIPLAAVAEPHHLRRLFRPARLSRTRLPRRVLVRPLPQLYRSRSARR